MYFKYDGITIYYEKYGTNNKSIIILPGWGDTRKTFNYMINFLKEYFTVYILDYPGFGNSIFPNKDLTIYDYTLLINEWINELNIKDPILIGHSFGGRIITTLLGCYKYKVSDVIYINSAGIKPKKRLKQRLKTFIYKSLKKIKYILPERIKEKYINFLFKKFASSDYKELDIKMMNTFKNIVNTDLRHYLKYINSRVLLIWGNNDLSTPIKDANIMHKSIPNSELIILNKAGHFSYLDYPYLVNSILYEQLKDYIK